MANCIAIATGYDKGRAKTVHRLGSDDAIVDANTWQTFVHASVRKDGTVYLRVTRNGIILHEWSYEIPEE